MKVTFPQILPGDIIVAVDYKSNKNYFLCLTQPETTTSNFVSVFDLAQNYSGLLLCCEAPACNNQSIYRDGKCIYGLDLRIIRPENNG